MTGNVKQSRQRTMFSREEIDAVVGILPEKQIALLREAATGKNYKEIGLSLGIPRMIVSGKLSQARAAIILVQTRRDRETNLAWSQHQNEDRAHG